MAATKKADKKTRIFLRAADKGDVDRFIGTPLKTCQVQLETEIEVTGDVREVVDLAQMQQTAVNARINAMKIKEEK
jgi:hypothetical protein